MTDPDTAVTPETPSIDGIPLTPKDVSLSLPMPFDSAEDERAHVKAKLAGALRIFGRFGFGEGVAGHITVRDPEFPDHFWVNPFGMSFRHIRSSDLILVNHDGDVVYGAQPVNRAAFVLAERCIAAEVKRRQLVLRARLERVKERKHALLRQLVE